MLKYLRAIAIWLLPPLGFVALPIDAPGYTCVAMIYLYLVGLILALTFFIRFFLTRDKANAAGAAFLVAMLWLLVYQNGFTFGARVHLLVNERRYLATIEELNRAKSSAEKARICGEGCDPSSAQGIVVFHYCHCFLSWPDLVYDPNDALKAPREELEKINLFLHSSERLSKFWYIGYFSD